MTKILVLDLEGTLISNAMSQLPRPGLYDFLTFCFERFDGVVLYTAVRATKAREILCSLVDEGLAPPAFATMSIVQWNPRETRKELRRVCELFSGSSLHSVRIVDDDEDWIVEAEREFWFPIAYWESPYSEDDRALFGMMETLQKWYLS
ncbi:MAG: hypothetical protein CL920_17475 [Deltaproteobacteria bacterium]|nr:hypothetical protein [Deltaproteobacteria bacterium]